MGCKCKKNRDSDYTEGGFDDNGRVYDYEATKKAQRRSCLCKTLKITLIIVFVILVLAFITAYVILPIIFMCSIEIQRFVMFPNILQPEDPEYDNYAKYDAPGVKNYYLTVDDIDDPSEKVSLGIWQVVPTDRIADSTKPGFDYSEELKNSKKPVIIYFHGNSGTRIFPMNTYRVLRDFFHVIAFDYRSYGDSSPALLTEKAVVNDAVQLYMQIKDKTTADIYVWGHSLGTALSTHTLKKLREKSIVPKGLILEAPFSTMREEIPNHPLGKYFAWLPWFGPTILDPLEDNEFYFKTTTNILDVDCPIMIVHAEDDSIIPFKLSQKLERVATENNKNVTYYLISAKHRCNHLNINTYPPLRGYIEKFVEVTNAFEIQNKKVKKSVNLY